MSVVVHGGGGNNRFTRVDYNLRERPFIPFPDISSSGAGLAAATIDGRVFVTGGDSGIVRGNVDIYDSSGRRESGVNITGRSRLAAAVGGGNVVFAGGGGSLPGSTPSSTVDRFTSAGVRTTWPGLTVGRDSLAGTRDGNGNVLFAGGTTITTTHSLIVSSYVVDRYTPAGVRSAVPTFQMQRHNLAAATDGNGNALFGGGLSFIGNNLPQTVETRQNMDRYAPDGTRTGGSNLITARHSLSAATDSGGNVVFAGGITTGSTPSSIVDRFTAAGVRSSGTSLSVPRSGMTAATDSDGNIYFAGGLASNGVTGVIDMYTTAGVRTSISGMTPRRGLVSGTDSNGFVLFAGGHASTGNTSIVERMSSFSRKIEFILPIGSRYKFKENNDEQTVLVSNLSVPLPNSGYIEYRKGAISL
jgi:hypothetical protein